MINKRLICILLISTILSVVLNITTLTFIAMGNLLIHERMTCAQTIEEETLTEIEPVTPTPTPTPMPQPKSLGKFKLTAYCPCSICCGSYADGITSTGKIAVAGRTIAVDPTTIPYGSKVTINGHTYIAEDCGGAIKGNKIDIYFDSHQEALQFGVQYAEVFVEAA